MQTEIHSPDDLAQQAISTLSGLGGEKQHQVLVTMFTAVYEHQASGDIGVLETMARDVAFTMRVQQSERYQKLVQNGPLKPSDSGRRVSEVLADLGR